jgi:hypothetical protein
VTGTVKEALEAVKRRKDELRILCMVSIKWEN